MRTFIHVKILMPNEFDFQNEAMNWVKINFPEASLFDFDNNSSAEIFQYSTQFLNAATEKIILIEKKSEAPATAVATWVEKILKQDTDAHFYILGDDKFLNILSTKKPKQVLLVKLDAEWKEEMLKLWNHK